MNNQVKKVSERTLEEKSLVFSKDSVINKEELPSYEKLHTREIIKDYKKRLVSDQEKDKWELLLKRAVGVKETEGKLYYELSWEFIEEIAKRMANNKSDKYPLYNWKKNIDTEDLKQAINRHHIEVMKGNYKDGDEVLGHIVSYACNSMMLWEQLKNK